MSSRGGKKKGKKGIDIFLRIRPCKRPSDYWELEEDDTKVKFEVPANASGGGAVNNTQISHNFRFNSVLNMKAQQDEVFAVVARGPVLSVLDGFNATIFAYGQTGSGKTFTITGGPERYVDRGIIPRALSMIFDEVKQRSGAQFQVHISYLEIYNNTGYDLLDPSHETKRLEDLPRVTMREDEDGNVHLRGLSTHLAGTEEDALNLLFLGDTNRAIAETPMNMASSRSHCIFTVFVESREAGSDVIRRSKLHLVDLAGSERVHKTNSSGQVLREAQHINQSLHYLEVVILALHEKKTKGREHIPYRNSMMTSVLRDSLGGNCKTVMVATINPEARHTDESVSTCRFAQRVALIQNEAKLNEQVDPALVVKRLKAEIKALQGEVAYLREQLGQGEGGSKDSGGELEEHEIRRLREYVQAYVDQFRSDPGVPLSLGGNPSYARIHAAYRILREIALETAGAGAGRPGGKASDSQSGDSAELAELRELLAHRDNEISILVNMVKRGKSVPPANFDDGPASSASSSSPRHSSSAGGGATATMLPSLSSRVDPHGGQKAQQHQQHQRQQPQHPHSARGAGRGNMGMPESLSADVLSDKRRSFDVFRKSYAHNRAIEENKSLLRTRYNDAKKMGRLVNEARSAINGIKSRIEQLRVEQAMVGGNPDASTEGKSGPTGADAALESQLQREMQTYKSRYKENFSQLRDLKGEVERIQSRLQKQRVRMQKEFETWYGTMLRNGEASGAQPQTNGGPGNSGGLRDAPPLRAAEAWRGSTADSASSASTAVPTAGGASAQFLTGDETVDQDILAFFKAKEELMKRSKGGR